MALSHAILTAVSHEPLSGYDLAKTFNTSTGFFWRASRQQIYQELRRLEERGFLTGMRHEQQRYPDKMVWTITPAGMASLQAWLDAFAEPASIKEELLVKLYALEFADLAAFETQLAERRSYHAERLNLFLSIERKLDARAGTGIRALGRLLGVRSGVRYEQAMRDWCDDAMLEISTRRSGVLVEDGG